MASRASFGAIDKMESGKWRARCTGPDGKRRSATFPTKADARVWLATQQTDAVRRMWRAPEGARRTVDEFAADYLKRQDLRDSTRVLYANLWRLHLADRWTGVEVGDVTPAMVRSWHTTAAATTGPAVLAQSYRLLRAVLGVAVADDAIPANPCKLRGASTPKAARPSRALTAAEATAVADHLGRSTRTDRYSALVLVLTFAGLRFGEAAALRRSDVLDGGERLRIERAVRYYDGRWVVGEPKTEAGHRTVALPTSVRIALLKHMDRYVPDTPDALVFGTRSGGFLSVANFGKTFRRAADAVGLGPVRLHELRHTGATLAAAAGASTKELMRRLGHASPDAALIYQHANDDRDAEIARALEARIKPPPPPPPTTRRSRPTNRPGPRR
ncbi:site-specific integrase [Klenkia sp. PcliD-1-E]|uniref:site-specific integrase n=1 Tax=Klenkia sp. PcliD-1-E TaxID=2954492 RepID=UPI0020979A17|nr:site-specific integrase [Klenkia sp. PcliD-1-E]MCO7218288.1 site-specific integrase [Klenkia sp. PcliD-1-E]